MERRDVFISYHTASSKEKVLKICQALESVGISCWYAPRDVEGDYASAIVRGIRDCKVFLLILNEYADRSEDVRNEINCAFERLRQHENIALLPFKVDTCVLSDANHYYLGRIHMMDGGQPPEPLRIRELVDRIRHILDKGPEITLILQEECGSQQERRYRITGQMVYPDPHFIGRQDVLRAIDVQLTGAANKVALVGMGGIGKSEIAKKYLLENTGNYDVLLWVPFDGSLQRTVASDSLFPIQGLSHKDYAEDDERAYFQRKLKLLKQIADRRVLIIVDNFDVTEDPDLKDFCGGSYGVIFTTRHHQKKNGLPEVKISGMTSEEDQMALFRAEHLRQLREDDLETVRKILHLLEGHPLSIRLVASAMQKNRRLRPEEMLQKLKSGAAHEEKQDVKEIGTIGACLRQVFQVSSMTEDELYLLKNLALIPLRGIQIDAFYDWCQMDEFDVIDGLIDKSWVVHNPVADTVHLHPLVADLMIEELKKDPGCCETLVNNLKVACQVDFDYTWEQKVALNDFATALYERLPQDHPQRPIALDVKARLCMSMADYEQSALLFRQLLNYAKDREQRMELHRKHAHAWVLGGFSQECIEAAQAGIAEIADVPLDQLTRLEGNWLGELYNRLTEAYVNLQQYDQAVDYARLALEKCDRFYNKTYESSRGWRDFHLAKALLYADRYEEAEQVIHHAISMFEKNKDMWSANYAYDILGQIMAKTGRFEEALRLNERSAEILQPLYGNEHADVAVNLEYRGNIYAAMGQREKARGYYRQAADIFRKRNCFKRAACLLNKLGENDA